MQFLGEGVLATAPPYPTMSQLAGAPCRFVAPPLLWDASVCRTRVRKGTTSPAKGGSPPASGIGRGRGRRQSDGSEADPKRARPDSQEIWREVTQADPCGS